MIAGMITEKGLIQRFSWSSRMEHWVQMLSFVALAITGLIQRYDGAWISEKLISGMSGIEVVRDIHRVFATVMMVAVVYHFGAALYRKFVLSRPRVMVPSKADAKAFGGSLKYAFGRTDAPPAQGRFTWEEKVEYWAFVWGTVVMVVSGFLLWNPIATTNIFPGEWIPTAKVIHGGEATLAVLSIVVWHIYHVHIAHFNKSMFTGKMSRQEMEEFHPLELASIDAGEFPTPPLEERRRRLRRFVPVYSFLSVVLLAGVYVFVSFEDTAIETIKPAEQVEVFAPVETLPPTSTTTPGATTTSTTVDGTTSTTVVTAGATWDGGVAAFFTPSCTGCHGTMGGLDLSSYDSAVAGGVSGAGIVPGDSADSVIAQRMAAGGHPGLLSDEDLATFIAWIDDGAPESSDTTTTTVVSAGDTWDGVVAGFFNPTCTGCHGTSGGLDLSSYEAAVAGGRSGPGIVPGDPGASMIVRTMAGSHPGLLSDEDLAALITWINAGAAEN
jgi:formate dehydrogenase gamma subunit